MNDEAWHWLLLPELIREYQVTRLQTKLGFVTLKCTINIQIICHFYRWLHSLFYRWRDFGGVRNSALKPFCITTNHLLLTAGTKYTKETAYLHITYDKKIRYISIFDVMNTFNVTQDKSSHKSWCQGFISSPLFSRAVAAMCAPLHHFQPVQVWLKSHEVHPNCSGADGPGLGVTKLQPPKLVFTHPFVVRLCSIWKFLAVSVRHGFY